MSFNRFIAYAAICTLSVSACSGSDIAFDPFEENRIDSVRVFEQEKRVSRKLDSMEIRQLIVALNNSIYDGLYKAMPQYQFNIYANAHTTPRIVISFGNHVKLKAECGDHAFLIKDDLLFSTH